VKARTLIGLAVVGGLGYVIVRFVRETLSAAGGAVKDAHATAVGKTADVLTRLFGPELSAEAQESTFFTVTFDDNGSRRAVPASSVNAEGFFKFENPPMQARTYALYRDKEGKKHARPII
jgi:hypothetical protein